MCGLLVLTDHDVEEERFSAAFETLFKRGPDMSRVFNHGTMTFAFQRLAIMDFHETGMQPFIYHKNILVANAEIYNDKTLRQTYVPQYTCTSQSDCEVLLPLYETLGTAMFKLLDAEFAIVLWDDFNKEVVAARDPIGIRPLFYGYLKSNGKIAFASEVKALIDLVAHVYPFPPGHYYRAGVFKPYTDLTTIEVNKGHSVDAIVKTIRKQLEKGVLKRLHSDAEMGFLLSGGLDSSLVCSIAQKHLKKPIRTFAIGMATDAIDLKYARMVATFLKTDHTEVIMSKEMVISALKEVIQALETYDITTIRASIGMYLLAKHIKATTNIKVLLTGEVSDELFGYKYTDYAPSGTAFQEESIKRLKELHQYDVLRADRCLGANHLEARVPFADLDFVHHVLSIVPELKMNSTGIGKHLLRQAFDTSDLPQDILYREKAAFSDAVGHSMVDDLKAYAQTCYSDVDFETRRQTYDIHPPISKESLLYREIFESFYPGHADLVPGFWMPNRTWDHCDVDDPSARVLKNYGKSGT
ncbi:MAG: asparagine synthase B [Acholeplasmataceae bacterium]|nr:asparagine synthase B [Acholeplasmataceae bacterium]